LKEVIPGPYVARGLVVRTHCFRLFDFDKTGLPKNNLANL